MRKNLKELSKNQLTKKNYWSFVFAFVIFAIIEGIILWLQRDHFNLISSIVAIFLLIPLQFGLYLTALRIIEGKMHICSFLFYISRGFKKYIKSIGLIVLLSIIIGVGTFFFIIPGIILSLMFSQAIFIMAKSNCGIIEALSLSNKIMKGHKWEFFVLEWSFILWYILIGITAGIAGIFVLPYIYTTFANYYEQRHVNYEVKLHTFQG